MNAFTKAARTSQAARENIGQVIHGYATPIDMMLVALAATGHALLEGVPGLGKTTLAKSVAVTAGLQFKRIQMTPDMMPSDITGHSFYDTAAGKFEMRRGPAFTNILLADEINRAPPRTQSALLEVMEERQVTIEGVTMPVPDPFLVIATKNPIDIEGVYPLPEAQLDRFMLHIPLGYPDSSVELAMLMGKVGRPGSLVTATPDLVPTLREAARQVSVHEDIIRYILDIVRQTRDHPDIELGGGPRASEHLVAAARGRAAIEGRSYVIPDDVKWLAPSVIAHRLILKPEADAQGRSARTVIEHIVDATAAPVAQERKE